jgi:hypothetical protein
MPTEPYKVAGVRKLAKATGKLAKTMSPEAPEITWEPGEEAAGNTLNAPLPGEVIVPLVVMMGLLQSAGLSKLVEDPLTVRDNQGLNALIVKTTRAAGDKSLKKLVKDVEKASKEPASPEGAPPAEENPEDDAVLMDSM